MLSRASSVFLYAPSLLSHAPSMLARAPSQPLSSVQLSLHYRNFTRERSVRLFWMLFGEEPVMAPPTAHHGIFCSYPLSPSLLLFRFVSERLRPAANYLCIKCAIVYVVISYPLYILRPFFLFALYISVARCNVQYSSSHQASHG